MKKVSIHLILVCVFSFGCTNNSPEKKPAADTLITATDNIISNSLPKADTVSVLENYDEIGFELLKTESIGELKIGLSGIKIKELIGEPEEKSKAEEWGADGEIHQNWIYKKEGVSLEMIGKDVSNQLINSITITAPFKFKTSRQIGIGSLIEEVKTAYDKEIDKSGSDSDNIVAGSVYGGIIFNFEEGKVKGVFIGSGAE